MEPDFRERAPKRLSCSCSSLIEKSSVFFELKGEITGKPTVITADLTITYVDGTRRRLEITTGENDVPTFTEAESTIVLLQGPCNSPNGYLDEIRTEQCIGSSQQQVLQCLATGWAALSECPTELLAEEANLVSSNGNEHPFISCF